VDADAGSRHTFNLGNFSDSMPARRLAVVPEKIMSLRDVKLTHRHNARAGFPAAGLIKGFPIVFPERQAC
jgi:hypothetical protein